MQEGRKEHII